MIRDTYPSDLSSLLLCLSLHVLLLLSCRPQTPVAQQVGMVQTAQAFQLENRALGILLDASGNPYCCGTTPVFVPLTLLCLSL